MQTAVYRLAEGEALWLQLMKGGQWFLTAEFIKPGHSGGFS